VKAAHLVAGEVHCGRFHTARPSAIRFHLRPGRCAQAKLPWAARAHGNGDVRRLNQLQLNEIFGEPLQLLACRAWK
jgi:hypothetical protein